MATAAAGQVELPTHCYGERIPWEVPIQLCIGDFLRAGGCGLDVGANVGGLSVAMSRMVGPRGQIHAFEANPLMIPRLRRELAANGAANVTVVGRAAWKRSGELLPFFCDDSYYSVGSSLFFHQQSWQQVEVETVSLDDYCRSAGLNPQVIKLDVEGAEFFVLEGAAWLLSNQAPVIVFEYVAGRGDEAHDAAEYLRERGYALLDTSLYRRVDRAFYLAHFERPPLVNVIAVPETRLAASGYARISMEPIDAFDCVEQTRRSRDVALARAGRYRVAAQFSGPDDAVIALRVLDAEEQSLAYYEGSIAELRPHTYSHLIFETARPATIRVDISPREEVAVSLVHVDVARIGLGRD